MFRPRLDIPLGRAPRRFLRILAGPRQVGNTTIAREARAAPGLVPHAAHPPGRPGTPPPARLLASVLVLLLSSCSAPPHTTPATDAPSDVPKLPEAAEATVESITDEECLARGGHVETEQTGARLRRRPPRPGEEVRPYKVCRVPSPENGRSCSSSAECGLGRCRCGGELARRDPANDPELQRRDGTPGTGVCSDAPLESGTWWCLVEDGKVVLHGIIID